MYRKKYPSTLLELIEECIVSVGAASTFPNVDYGIVSRRRRLHVFLQRPMRQIRRRRIDQQEYSTTAPKLFQDREIRVASLDGRHEVPMWLRFRMVDLRVERQLTVVVEGQREDKSTLTPLEAIIQGTRPLTIACSNLDDPSISGQIKDPIQKLVGPPCAAISFEEGISSLWSTSRTVKNFVELREGLRYRLRCPVSIGSKTLLNLKHPSVIFLTSKDGSSRQVEFRILRLQQAGRWESKDCMEAPPPPSRTSRILLLLFAVRLVFGQHERGSQGCGASSTCSNADSGERAHGAGENRSFPSGSSSSCRYVVVARSAALLLGTRQEHQMIGSSWCRFLLVLRASCCLLLGWVVGARPWSVKLVVLGKEFIPSLKGFSFEQRLSEFNYGTVLCDCSSSRSLHSSLLRSTIAWSYE